MALISRICFAVLFVSASITANAYNPKVKGVHSATYQATSTIGGSGSISQSGKVGISFNASKQAGATAGQWAQANASTAAIGTKSTVSAISKARYLKNFLKVNLYTTVGLIALDYISDRYGWFEQDGTLYYQPNPDAIPYPITEGLHLHDPYVSTVTGYYASAEEACQSSSRCSSHGSCFPFHKSYSGGLPWGQCKATAGSAAYATWRVQKTCEQPSYMTPYGCYITPEAELLPVTVDMVNAIPEAELTDATLTNADAKKLFDFISDADQLEIITQPQPVVLPSITTTNPDGTVTEETKTVTPEAVVLPDNTIAVNYTTESVTNTYEDGNLVDSSTTTTTVNNELATQTEQQQQQEQKTDCAFMPTVCTFIEWFKADDEEIVVSDLEELRVQEQVITEKNYNIDFGNNSCPSPKQINLNFFGASSYEISYQPFCDIASKFRFFVLAISYFLAVRIVSGVVR